jgi:hypothetical protein
MSTTNAEGAHLALPLAFLDYVFPVILAFIAGFRLLTAATSKVDYLNRSPSETESKEYDFLRLQLLTLAFFAITVITLAVTVFVTTQTISIGFEYALGYLSVAMFCFFISSYMYSFRITNRLPYIGETLEFVGIVSLGIGFFYLVVQVVPTSIWLGVLYMIFLSALVGVAGYELYLNNRKRFHPR